MKKCVFQGPAALMLMSLMMIAGTGTGRGQDLGDVIVSIDDRQQAVEQRHQSWVGLGNNISDTSTTIPAADQIEWPAGLGERPTVSQVNNLSLEGKVAVLNQAIVEFERLKVQYLNARPSDFVKGSSADRKVGALRTFFADDFPALPRVTAANYQTVLLELAGRVRRLSVLSWNLAGRYEQNIWRVDKRQLDDNWDGTPEETYEEPSEHVMGFEPTTFAAGTRKAPEDPLWLLSNVPYYGLEEKFSYSGTLATGEESDGHGKTRTIKVLQITTTADVVAEVRTLVESSAANQLSGAVHVLGRTDWSNVTGVGAPSDWDRNNAGFMVLGSVSSGSLSLSATGPAITVQGQWVVQSSSEDDELKAFFATGQKTGEEALSHHTPGNPLSRQLHGVLVPEFERGIDAPEKAEALEKSLKALASAGADGGVTLHPRPSLYYGIDLGPGLSGNQTGMLGVATVHKLLGAVGGFPGEVVAGLYYPLTNGVLMEPADGYRADYASHLRLVGAAGDFHVVYETLRDQRGASLPALGRPFSSGGFDTSSMKYSWDLPRIRQVVGRDLVADITYQGHRAYTVKIYRRPPGAAAPDLTPGTLVPLTGLTECRTWVISNPAATTDYPTSPEQLAISGSGTYYKIGRDRLDVTGDTILFETAESASAPAKWTKKIENKPAVGTAGSEVEVTVDGESSGGLTLSREWDWWDHKVAASESLVTDDGTATVTNTLSTFVPGAQNGRYPLSSTRTFPDQAPATTTWNNSGLLTSASQSPWAIDGAVTGNAHTLTYKLNTSTYLTEETSFLNGGETVKVTRSTGGMTNSSETTYGTATDGLPGLPRLVKNSDGTGATFTWQWVAPADSMVFTMEQGKLSGSSVSNGTRFIRTTNARGWPTGSGTFLLPSGLKTGGTVFADFTDWGAPKKETNYNTGLASKWEFAGPLSRLSTHTGPMGMVSGISAYDVLGRPTSANVNTINAALSYQGPSSSATLTGSAAGSISETRDALGRLTASQTTWSGVEQGLGVDRSVAGTVKFTTTHELLGGHEAKVRTADGSMSESKGATAPFGGLGGTAPEVEGGLLKSTEQLKKTGGTLTGAYLTTWADALGRVRKTATASTAATGADQTLHEHQDSSSLKRVITREPSGRVLISETDPYNSSGSIHRSGIDFNDDGVLTSGSNDRFVESTTTVSGGIVRTTVLLTEDSGLREVLRTDWTPAGNQTVTRINEGEETITRSFSNVVTPPSSSATVTVTTQSSKGWTRTETLDNQGLTDSGTLTGTGLPTLGLNPEWRADGSLQSVSLDIGTQTHSATFKTDGTLATLVAPGKGNILGSHAVANGVETLTVDGVTREQKLDGTQVTTGGNGVQTRTVSLDTEGDGFKMATTPAGGSSTNEIFNAGGAAIEKDYPGSHDEDRSYYAGGLLKDVTLARGGKVTMGYSPDGAKDLTSTNWPAMTSGTLSAASVAQGYGYDRAGRVDSISDPSGSRDLVYVNGRLKRTTWGSGSLAGYKVVRLMDGQGRSTGFELWKGDVLVHSGGRVPNGVSEEISELTSGALKVKVGRNGDRQVTGFQWGNSAGTFTPVVTQSWQRGTSGRVLLASSTGASGAPTFDYKGTANNEATSFDANGRRLKVKTAGSDWTYQYTNGQITSASHATLGSFSYQFDGFGRRTENSANVGNTLNQTTGWTHSQSKTLKITADADARVWFNGTEIPSFSGSYDQSITSPGVNGGWVAWHTLAVLEGEGDTGANADAKSEKRGAVWVPPVSETLAYDQAGNRESNAQWEYAWNGKNELVRARTKNLGTAAYGYDITFGYDAEGRRFKKDVTRYRDGAVVEQKLVTYVWDGWDLLYERHQGPGGLTVLERKYLWGPDIAGGSAGGAGGLLLIRETQGTVTTDLYPLYDGTGHVTALAGSTGTLQAEYAYGPFGELIHAKGPAAQANPWRYATKYFDEETGLYYFGKRYLDPVTGQWLSREPLGESESLNLYSYCHNDPVNNIDRLGLESVPVYRGQISEAMAKLGWAPGEHARKSAAIDVGPWMEMFAGLEALAHKGDPRALDQLRLLSDVYQGSHEMNDLWLDVTMRGAQARIDVASAGINRIYRQAGFLEWVSGREPGSLDPAGDPAYFDDDNPEFQSGEWSRRFIQFSPGGKIARESVNGNYGAASYEFGKEVVIWSTLGIAGEFVGTGRVAFGVTRGSMGGGTPALLWHGSTAGVARRNASGIFVDGTGNGGLFWATSKQMNELGPLAWKVGGNTNVRLLPPGLVNKGGLEATYRLSSAESAMFRKAWGPRFNWNPYQWWKGAAGQYYYRPTPATWGQRFGELGKAGIITGAGAGGGYFFNNLLED